MVRRASASSIGHAELHQSPGARKKSPHIAIVGAGISGLRCADILLSHGFKVTILEGRSRIGGRMHQETLPMTSYLVDLGPNWIHGTEDNPILDLAKQTGTTTHSFGETHALFDELGKRISGQDGKELSDIMWSMVVDAFAYSNAHSKEIPPDRSLFDFFEDKIRGAVPEDVEGWREKRKLVLQIAQMWGAFVGQRVERQSLKFFWLEECLEGENLFCASTYQKILQQIARPALAKADVRFGTVVDTVSSESRGVLLKTSIGEGLAFDEVVVTSPLGWMKQHQKAFTPALPERICSAIDSLGYGCLEKAFITFPTAFWLTPSQTGFLQFLSPTYSPLNPGRWNQETVELGTLPNGNAHPTLLFYIFGAQSQHLSRQISTLFASDKQAFLMSYFQPYFCRLEGYDAARKDCIPISAHFTDWVADDLAGNGSYSNFMTEEHRPESRHTTAKLCGQEMNREREQQLDKDIIALRHGMPERHVWFAGEHTAPFVALGTVTGAYWSGEAVGRRIAEAYGMDGIEDVDLHADGMENVDSQAKGLKRKDQATRQGTKDKEVNVRGFADDGLEKSQS